MRFAWLADVDTEIMRERLVDYRFGCVDHCYWNLPLLGQSHEFGCDAEADRVCIDKDRRRLGGGQSPHDRGDARTQPFAGSLGASASVSGSAGTSMTR